MTRLSLVAKNKLSVRAQPRAFQLRSCIFPEEVRELHIVTEISACTAVHNVHISLSLCLTTALVLESLLSSYHQY